MVSLHDGQCGLCAHFGETHPELPQMVAILAAQDHLVNVDT
jgi:hypothetical protein